MENLKKQYEREPDKYRHLKEHEYMIQHIVWTSIHRMSGIKLSDIFGGK